MIPLDDEPLPVLGPSQESLVARHPALVGDEINQRQGLEQTRHPLAGHPISLVVVGPRGHDDRSTHPGDLPPIHGPLRGLGLHHEVRIWHLSPVATLLTEHSVGKASDFNGLPLEAPEHRLGHGGLGHGPVIGPMPSGMFFGMTGTALGRSHITEGPFGLREVGRQQRGGGLNQGPNPIDQPVTGQQSRSGKGSMNPQPNYNHRKLRLSIHGQEFFGWRLRFLTRTKEGPMENP